jgi:hypothetical protein
MDPRYPLDRRLGGPQNWSGHRGQRKNPLPLPGIEPRSPSRPARSHTLYCLSHPGSSYASVKQEMTGFQHTIYILTKLCKTWASFHHKGKQTSIQDIQYGCSSSKIWTFFIQLPPCHPGLNLLRWYGAVFKNMSQNEMKLSNLTMQCS